MRRIAWVSVALLLSLAAGAMAANKSAPVQLREGLYAEEVEGNLDSAIKIYQQVIDDKTASGDQVAQALYRQGMCYMKKKSEAEAKANFARLVAEHGDQTDLVAKVKPLLEELGNADPAGLMPAETLLYVEIGSPGKQIEAILNLLKGTPLENPLAALGNAGGGGNSQGPAAILSALTNPSMMAEFKKIRGLGVGFQQIGDDVPEAMLVMYPGKSDALRGILQMVLGLIGKSSEAVEGMQAVHFDGGGGAAFDDTVIIVTTPTEKGTERLKWAVQQYKGLANNPTLASGNKPFAKVGKKARQENVVTVWVNVAQAYQTMLKTLPPDQVPEQIRTVDGFVDLKNVDSIIAGLTLKDTGVAVEANIDLKNGHNCQAYHLIRTPPLNMALLQAVPSDATTLVAFGLGDANTPQAEAAGRQIKNALGLDVGPQIFGNIRQVSVFTAPPVKPVDTNDGVSAFLQGCLGVAVTSNDPAQTRSLLTTLLRSAKLLAPAADGQTQEIKVVNGRFQIALANKMQVFGCVDEGSKTTVLALGPALIDSSVKAVRQKNSVLDSGRLKNAVAALPKTTSKLAAVNVGGQMQIAALVSHADDPNTQERVRKVFTQLAQICEQTTVLLHTTEETNSLGVRVALTGLPKADQLVGPITELAGLLESGQGDDWSDGGEQEMQMPADVTKRDAKPVVTGTLEEGWASAKSYELKNALYNPISGPADLSASFKAMYDDDKLYLLVDVNDDDAAGRLLGLLAGRLCRDLHRRRQQPVRCLRRQRLSLRIPHEGHGTRGRRSLAREDRRHHGYPYHDGPWLSHSRPVPLGQARHQAPAGDDVRPGCPGQR